MTRRFTIEDLVMQDSGGVIFRAADQQSGKSVAVRRFFPHGSSGSGLVGEERLAYDVAIERLTGVKHKALRAVVAGGCDPVDGIPFIATEWVEGIPLEPLLQQGPLLPREAIELISQALELSQILSHVLAEEAVWVETNPRMILVGTEESGRGFLFWISPLKGLGKENERRGLEPILLLTEKIMGWSGKNVSDEAANGLGSWYKWLREHRKATLHEAMEMLAASTGSEPPPPVKALVQKAAAPAKGDRLGMVVRLASLLLIMATAAWWFQQRASLAPATAGHSPAASPSKPAETIVQSFAPYDSELLLNERGNTVIVVGKLAELDMASPAGIYLNFSRSPAPEQARGLVGARQMTPEFDKSVLLPLIGKNLRIRGELVVETSGSVNRPVVLVKDRASIEVVH